MAKLIPENSTLFFGCIVVVYSMAAFQLVDHGHRQIGVLFSVADKHVEIFPLKVRFRKKKVCKKFVMIKTDTNSLADAHDRDGDKCD